VSALLAGSPALLVGVVFFLGLLVGSFLNVVIYREPVRLQHEWRDEAQRILGQTPEARAPFNLVTPRSACPSCQAPISAWQNIPLLSWLLLGRRCASCKASISARYPLIELFTGLLSAAVAWRYGWSLALAFGLIITWALIALSGIDYDTQYLPDSLTLPLLWLGLLASLFAGSVPITAAPAALPVTPDRAIVGAVAGYLALWSVYWVFKLATGKEGMGYGDFKLLAALGAWLGPGMLLPIILLSAGVGSIVGITMILALGRDKQLPIPFGPYLAAAGWIAMLFGPGLVQAWSRFILQT
jgi:leader peptidase (prepilin peptidase) / N-methyltransferase